MDELPARGEPLDFNPTFARSERGMREWNTGFLVDAVDLIEQ
ncbi:hypothetical protein [Salinarimonas soli]|nr:hypothetical protein [Salinarimonas soli]